MSEKGSFLDKILAAKRADLAAPRATRSGALSDRELYELGARLPRPRDFIAALREGPRPAIIAEFKRASPSAGVLREHADQRADRPALQRVARRSADDPPVGRAAAAL
jgi:indole-3-glycerol phosphate synthase